MIDGQWLGSPQGHPSADVMVDLEVRGDHYEGTAFLFENDGAPGSLVFLRTADLSEHHRLENLPVTPISPLGGAITHQQVAEWFPNVTFPQTATVEFRLKPRSLQTTWNSSAGTRGTASLRKSKADKPSDYSAIRGVRSWPQFKKFALGLEHRRFIFRGQCEGKRLRTGFHRTWRKNLVRFINQDIQALHQSLSARTKHVFNLNDPLQHAAFWNLAQHHGYPTPLLDWTYSPFVAAFFALREHRTELHGQRARILVFDKAAWCTDFRQLQHATFMSPHFSILEALAIENDRAIPQQAVSSVTNIDDIESYVRKLEKLAGKTYLRAVDLDGSERQAILEELAQMGITAGSMFPGLDGACQELKARFFGY